GVRVGQSRHQHPPAQVDRASTVRAPLPVVRDAADDTVFDQDRGVLAQRRPGTVEKPRSGQPEPPLLWGRSRDQCREPVRHVVTTLRCLLTRYPQTVVTHPAPRLPRWPAPARQLELVRGREGGCLVTLIHSGLLTNGRATEW